MTIVNVSDDCGNSPKNILLKELTIAFAKGDAHFILSKIAKDIQWNIVGQKHLRGKKDFALALEQMMKDELKEITIQHVISHGKAGAVNGMKGLKNGRTHAFCDVYEFINAKGTGVREITSYVLEID
jgi:hypothetical protein